jgi:hypothetical protein
VCPHRRNKVYTLKAGQRFVRPPSLQTPGSRECQTLAEAARCKAQMSVEFDQGATGFGAVQLKGFTDGDGVRTKQTPVGEGVAGAGGSLIPPVLMPEILAGRLEPDRIWSHLTTVSAVGQWATYLQHPSDTYPAAPAAELAPSRIPTRNIRRKPLYSPIFRSTGIQSRNFGGHQQRRVCLCGGVSCHASSSRLGRNFWSTTRTPARPFRRLV